MDIFLYFNVSVLISTYLKARIIIDVLIICLGSLSILWITKDENRMSFIESNNFFPMRNTSVILICSWSRASFLPLFHIRLLLLLHCPLWNKYSYNFWFFHYISSHVSSYKSSRAVFWELLYYFSVAVTLVPSILFLM